MEQNYHYASVSVALEELRKKGFTVDFNLEENCITCHPEKFHPEDFEIVEVYRYEGNSDPGDESTVYAIESKTGLKGVLVTSYGMYDEISSTELLHKLGQK